MDLSKLLKEKAQETSKIVDVVNPSAKMWTNILEEEQTNLATGWEVAKELDDRILLGIFTKVPHASALNQ